MLRKDNREVVLHPVEKLADILGELRARWLRRRKSSVELTFFVKAGSEHPFRQRQRLSMDPLGLFVVALTAQYRGQIVHAGQRR